MDQRRSTPNLSPPELLQYIDQSMILLCAALIHRMCVFTFMMSFTSLFVFPKPMMKRRKLIFVSSQGLKSLVCKYFWLPNSQGSNHGLEKFRILIKKRGSVNNVRGQFSQNIKRLSESQQYMSVSVCSSSHPLTLNLEVIDANIGILAVSNQNQIHYSWRC